MDHHTLWVLARVAPMAIGAMTAVVASLLGVWFARRKERAAGRTQGARRDRRLAGIGR